jgi:hypothetical protein
MSKENDLEGQQDQGGKHGGQKGMPKPADRPGSARGQEQPRDKERALQDKGDPPGIKTQR